MPQESTLTFRPCRLYIWGHIRKLSKRSSTWVNKLIAGTVTSTSLLQMFWDWVSGSGLTGVERSSSSLQGPWAASQTTKLSARARGALIRIFCISFVPWEEEITKEPMIFPYITHVDVKNVIWHVKTTRIFQMTPISCLVSSLSSWPVRKSFRLPYISVHFVCVLQWLQEKHIFCVRAEQVQVVEARTPGLLV